jgi:hypothetical protein
MPFHRSQANLAAPAGALSKFKEIAPTVRQRTKDNCADAASVQFSLTATPIMEVAWEKLVGSLNERSPGYISSGDSARDTNDVPTFTRLS